MKLIRNVLFSRKRRKILFLADAVALCLSFAFSWLLACGERISTEFIVYVAENVVLVMLSIIVFGAYSRIWRYAQAKDYFLLCVSVVAPMSVCYVFNRFAGVPASTQVIVNNQDGKASLMFAFLVCSGLLCAFSLVGMRLVYKMLRDARTGLVPISKNGCCKKRALVVGGGQACWLLLAEIQHTDCEYTVVGVIDDDSEKRGRIIDGVYVFGPIDKVGEVADRLKADTIIIAIPSASPEERRRIVRLCNETGIEVRTIPEIYNIVDSRKLISQMRKINAEDLLGREPVILDVKESGELIGGKTVMVTGGGGSIGSELCRQIIAYNPRKLIIVDISENNAYDIQQEIHSNYGPAAPIEVHISSVRDFAKMDVLFDRYRPEIVFHAAAHKHVPLMETDPEEALKNNVVGTYNIAYLADKYNTSRFLLISSDKAVNPTNVMGATKRFCEMLIQNFDAVSKSTEYCAVRFGNVLGSNGSVIPLFTKLIEQKKDLPVTHPEITRYFMTIPEAVSLVLRAGAMAGGGEIFVLDMGTPVKIADLARNLIRMHGYVPDRDIKIKYVGLRPGEKLYEETLMGGNLKSTKHGKIFIEETGIIDSAALIDSYKKLCASAESNDSASAVSALMSAVPTFRRAKDGIVAEKA